MREVGRWSQAGIAFAASAEVEGKAGQDELEGRGGEAGDRLEGRQEPDLGPSNNSKVALGIHWDRRRRHDSFCRHQGITPRAEV